MHAMSRERLVAIERVAVVAWPALETAEIDGWLWRYSGGGSQRANSVSALAFQGADVDAAIAEAEARYRARGASPMFQVCHVNAPAECARAKNPVSCLTARLKPEAQKKEEQL